MHLKADASQRMASARGILQPDILERDSGSGAPAFDWHQSRWLTLTEALFRDQCVLLLSGIHPIETADIVRATSQQVRDFMRRLAQGQTQAELPPHELCCVILVSASFLIPGLNIFIIIIKTILLTG